MSHQAYPPHAYAELFPLRDGASLTELAKSIAEHGQHEEIVLLNGHVLDGRRRQTACLRAGIKPLYREFGSRAGDGFDPLEFAFSVNFHRRDLTKVEKALAAVKMANCRRGFNPHSTNSHAAAFISQKTAAKKMEIAETQVARAKVVMDKGIPELQEAMRLEAVSISDAAAIAGQPAKVQAEALAAVKDGKAGTLKGAINRIVKRPANGSPVDGVGEICKDLDMLIERVGAIPAKDVQTRGLACESLKTARAFLRRLLGAHAAA